MRCCRPCWIGRSRESCSPLPVLPPNSKNRNLGEGELRVYMRQETINTKVRVRLVALRESQSATGEELDALLPSVLDRAFKGEL